MSSSSRNISYLVGSSDIDPSPLPIFSDEVIELLSEVSAFLLKGKLARLWPDVASFAYWCRRAHLRALQLTNGDSAKDRLGRGISFHVAPSNVPVNFAFSAAFALLAGNSCIVRVPTRHFEQVDVICEAFNSAIENHPDMRRRIAFLTYPADNAITEGFSRIADVRVLWGGDNTVASIRALPCPPRCVDVVFPDRYSVCVMDDAALGALDEREIAQLAKLFYNDTYLMDQNACSSPRIVFWQGSNTEARKRFWDALRSCASSTYQLQGAIVMDKYVQLCEDTIEGRVNAPLSFDPVLSVVALSSLPDNVSSISGRGGYFYEVDDLELGAIVERLDEKCQTITYFGIDPLELKEAVCASQSRGVDRIVPVGSAMDIDIDWDGYDLIGCMSRQIIAR